MGKRRVGERLIEVAKQVSLGDLLLCCSNPPVCTCGEVALQLTVRKEGANKGEGVWCDNTVQEKEVIGFSK